MHEANFDEAEKTFRQRCKTHARYLKFLRGRPGERAVRFMFWCVQGSDRCEVERGVFGQLTMEMAMTMDWIEGCRIATSTMASTTLGMVWKNSVKRMTALSMTPPK